MSQTVQSLPRIGVVVVAYNAASTLLRTLDRIPSNFLPRLSELIILDDASEDDTFQLAQAWAKRGLDLTTVVLRHTKNLGYGGNQKAAYQLAADRGLDVVVLLHGDGQYAPEMLPQMVKPIVDGEADAVIGSRMLIPGAAKAGGMPLYKRLGNTILTRMENAVLRTSLSEFHSGYRAYNLRALGQLPIQQNSDGFDFDTQIIVQLADAGRRIVELPIPTYYGDEICYVNGTRYAWDVTKDVVEYRLARKGFGTSEWVPHPEEYGFKEGDESSHSFILRMLESAPPLRILDLGCSGGLLAERLRGAGHYVVGVDFVEADGVRERVDEFYRVDLSDCMATEIGSGYDVVVLADVIEHLPNPLVVVERAASLLRPGGQLLLSVPNVGHWYPRARMTFGLFGYDRRGILDATHLRFFTRRTLLHLISRVGLDILEERHTGLPIGVVTVADGRKFPLVRGIDSALVALRPQLFAYQFVFRLTPHVESRQISVYARRPQDDSALADD